MPGQRLSEAPLQNAIDGLLIVRFLDLRQQADNAAAADRDLPLVGAFFSAQQAEEGGFAAAVAADQADLFALADIEGDVAQHKLGTVVFLNILT
ncbi:hypothetical protein D3C73_1083970 [compost metagenome]